MIDTLLAEIRAAQDSYVEKAQSVFKRLSAELDQLQEQDNAAASATSPRASIRDQVREFASHIVKQHAMIDKMSQDLEGRADEVVKIRLSRTSLQTEALANEQPLAEGKEKAQGGMQHEGVAEDMGREQPDAALPGEVNTPGDDATYLKVEDKTESPNKDESLATPKAGKAIRLSDVKEEISLEAEGDEQTYEPDEPLSPKTSRKRVSPTKSFCLRALDSLVFKIVMMISLAVALFGVGIWILADVPDSPGNAILDTLMCSVMLVFLVELVVRIFVEEAYLLSFFFWMDLLGTVSMLFEISFLLAALNVDTVVLRSARTAKLGARVGRLFKLLKCLAMFYRVSKEDSGSSADARVLSGRLMLILSTKVSILTIVMVMTLPLFSLPMFPTSDMSMKLWSQHVEESYHIAYETNSPDIFNRFVAELETFYDQSNYRPYKIVGYDVRTTSDGSSTIFLNHTLFTGAEPARKDNVLQVDVESCRLPRTECQHSARAAVYFDFTGARRVEAGMDMAMIFFVVFIMVLMSFDLNLTLDGFLVKPLERMLNIMRTQVTDIYDQLQEAHGTRLDDDEEKENMTEMQLLELVLYKVAHIAEIATSKNEMSSTQMENMDDGGKAVLVDMLNVNVVASVDWNGRPGSKSTVSSISGLAIAEFETHRTENLHSWKLDTLGMGVDQLGILIQDIFFVPQLDTINGLVDQSEFANFNEVVRTGYNDMPYHNYAHACDVLHTVYRMLCLTHAADWLNSVEQYGILLAALCHDLGHFGRTNPFLIETRHELAVRYNDSSPLENMHCARLFEICGLDNTRILSKLTLDQQKSLRKVCIAAILHTDLTHHFQMVKDIDQLYAIQSVTCDAQARHSELMPKYKTDILEPNKTLWFQLFLHMADVSNPLKPFKICKAWAWRVLDEFFEQGDEEKSLGITVGMLNDRDKVNRPGSQHGFINFLVAPLVAGGVRVFPHLEVLHSQMASNLKDWRDTWVADTKPPADEVAKKDVEVKKIQDLAESIKALGVQGSGGGATSGRRMSRLT
eukprot:TRINITY_DN21602_c0_g5_i1.p1 TRINITY_DN21602_c0_g5~~TRINITY_DN21602_c0_g5_i1.p1  ORF type:complete len:1049 (-),score=212.94 TRINITY_DN21602_c0_g5_i1:224-3298(-)